jgi:hypothetical protein
VSLAFVVVESSLAAVMSPIALQDFLSHSSLTFELVGLLAGSSFATLDCYSISLGGYATLDCKCWSIGCFLEDNCSVPHNLLALDR